MASKWHDQEPKIQAVEQPAATASAEEHRIYNALYRLTAAVERACLSAGILPEPATRTKKNADRAANTTSA